MLRSACPAKVSNKQSVPWCDRVLTLLIGTVLIQRLLRGGRYGPGQHKHSCRKAQAGRCCSLRYWENGHDRVRVVGGNSITSVQLGLFSQRREAL